MTLKYLAMVFQVGAAALAAALARHRPDHRPAMFFLVGMTVANLARFGIVRWILPNPPQAAPLTGALRIAGHVEHGLFLAWPAGLAALALVVLAERRAWPALVGWAIVLLVLAGSYPAIRGELLRKVYLAADLVALAVMAASFVAFWRRREATTPAIVIAMLLGAIELVVLFLGPWRGGLFGSAWTLAQGGYVVLYFVILLVEGGALWGSSS